MPRTGTRDHKKKDARVAEFLARFLSYLGLSFFGKIINSLADCHCPSPFLTLISQNPRNCRGAQNFKGVQILRTALAWWLKGNQRVSTSNPPTRLDLTSSCGTGSDCWIETKTPRINPTTTSIGSPTHPPPCLHGNATNAGQPFSGFMNPSAPIALSTYHLGARAHMLTENTRTKPSNS